MSDAFKNYIMDNLILLDGVSLPYSIQTINGGLTVTNNTYITSQPYFINAYLSTVSIENSTLYDITSDNSIFRAIISNVTLVDIHMNDLYTTELGKFLQLSSESKAFACNIEYTNSTIKFIETLSSHIQISNLSISNISLTQYVLDFAECHDVKLENILIHDINTTKRYMMNIARSSISQIINMTVHDVDVTILHILESNITLIDKIKLYDVAQGIYAQQSSINMIQNSHIYRSGSTNIIFGGALNLKDSSTTFMNVTLEYNTAQTGGAIHIDCDTYEICRNIMTNSTFANNIAVKQGGAINYNFRRPELSNEVFNDNIAAYGPDIASYPVRIVNSSMYNESMVLTNVASGIVYRETLKMTLIDYDNQIMNLVSNSQIKIVPVTNDAEIQSVDYSVLTNGQTEFDNLQFAHKPGQTNTKYIAT